MSRLLRSSLLLAAALAWGASAQAGQDRPVVRMPGLEQGSSVRGDVLLDVIMRPADDGTPLLKADLAIDEIPLITIDLQPSMRNVTFRWATADAQWGDGKHQIVAKVLDAKGREGVYRTFVYVWNQGRPETAAKAPASLDIQDTDGAPDNVITQKAMIHVKVDPNLGAKWVLIYLNDQLLAMLNYPPYQAMLDPKARHLDDGPVVVRAKVIHPDSSETTIDPVKLEVNLSGKYTPAGPGGLTPATPATPAPAIGPVSPTATATVPVPTETPGTASTSAVGAAVAPPVTVGADRPQGSRAVQPGVIDGGTVELAVPGSATPAGAATTVPAGPALTVGPDGKSAASRTRVMGPLQPARSAAGAPGGGAARSTGTLPASDGRAGSQAAITPQPVAVRLAAPRVGVGSATALRAPMAEPVLRSGSPRDALLASQQPAGTRLEAPRVDVATGEMGTAGAAPTMGPVMPGLSPRHEGDGAVVVTPGRATAPPITRAEPLPLGTVGSTTVAAPRRTGATPAVTLPAVAPTPAPRVATVSLKPGKIGRLHTVVRGDTIYGLAKKYGVSADALARVNNLKNVNLIRIGQKLVVPGGAMQVNGQAVKTDVAPVQMRQGIAASPFRYVVEALGGTVSWVGPAQQVVANTADRGVITISVGSNTAQVNEEQVLMDLAAYLEHGRTMVPVRFISTALDVTIEMDDDSGNILIKSNR